MTSAEDLNSHEHRHGDGAGAGRPRLWSAMSWSAGASTLANVLAYLFNLIMTRALGVVGYGELAPVLAVGLVTMVPAFALQSTVARRIASGLPAGRPVQDSLVVGAVVAAATLAVAPALEAAFGLTTLVPVLWTALTAIPITCCFACLGVLQGRRHFREFGIVLIAVQIARVLGGLVAAWVEPSASVALGTGAGLMTVLAVGAAAHSRSLVEPAASRRVFTDVLHDAAPFLGVLVLSNIDLLLARHYLPEFDSGIYAAGNLVTRAFFWGAAFLAISNFPSLSTPHERAHALRHGSLVLAALSAVGMTLAATVNGLVPKFVGSAYEPVTPLTWMFAAEGLALAWIQFALYASVAARGRLVGALVWLTVVCESVIIGAWLHAGMRQTVTVAMTGHLLLAVVAVATQLRPGRAPR